MYYQLAPFHDESGMAEQTRAFMRLKVPQNTFSIVRGAVGLVLLLILLLAYASWNGGQVSPSPPHRGFQWTPHITTSTSNSSNSSSSLIIELQAMNDNNNSSSMSLGKHTQPNTRKPAEKHASASPRKAAPLPVTADTHCPTWMSEYAAFHKQQRGQPGAKYLVYAACPGSSGLGDRIRGMMYLTRQAVALNRVILFTWRGAPHEAER